MAKKKTKKHNHEGEYSGWCFTCLQDQRDWLKGELQIKEDCIQQLMKELAYEKSK